MLLSEVAGVRLRTYTESPHKWDELLGIELEVEDIRYSTKCPDGYLTYWSAHTDNSLRNGIEYVTAGPYGGALLETAINQFYDAEFTYTKGPRTSTHIHINMTDVEEPVIQSLFLIMYMIEEGLFAAVEESRKWAGYSVPLTEMAPDRIRGILGSPMSKNFFNSVCPSRNAERYYGLNTNLRRHGTAEFRYFPGGPTKEELHSWIDFVVLAKKAAKKYSPSQLVDMLTSPFQIEQFLVANFGVWAARLLAGCNPEKMFVLFNDVSSMSGDDDLRELGTNVLWISQHVRRFIKSTVLEKNPEAGKFLDTLCRDTEVFPKNDWNYYMEQARDKIKTSKLPPVEYQNPFPRDEEDYDEDEDYEESNTVSPPPNEEDLARAYENLRMSLNRPIRDVVVPRPTSRTVRIVRPPTATLNPNGEVVWSDETWPMPRGQTLFVDMETEDGPTISGYNVTLPEPEAEPQREEEE